MSHEVELAEKELAQLKEQGKYGEAIERLRKNPDFKLVIEQGFMLHHCSRFVQQSVSTVLTNDQKQDALLKAQAAGHLKEFLDVQERLAAGARESFSKYEAEVDLMRAEDV